jgi:hypothetical protein
MSSRRKKEEKFAWLISICAWEWKRESIKIKAETKSLIEIWFGIWSINISNGDEFVSKWSNALIERKAICSLQ